MELEILRLIIFLLCVAIIIILLSVRQMIVWSRRRLAAVEVAGDGIGIADAEGKLVYMNRALMAMHEIKDLNEYIGQSWSNLYTEKGRDKIENVILPALKNVGSWHGESPVTTKEGKIFFAELFLTQLPDGGFIGSARDISQRKNDEKERDGLQQKLIQSQKMESLGALTGGIAHDFNNMLTIVLGHLETLEDTAEKTQANRNSFQAAKRAIGRSAELTQRLLAFSRQQILMPEILNINRLIPETIKMMQRTLGQQIEIIFYPDDELWNVKLDAGQLENTILNLCINARDAMAGSGAITIKTRNVSCAEIGQQREAFVIPGEYVEIMISDSGQGIPEEIIGKVFDPFFTTKEVGAGSGLGLSMVYGFTKQSGGYVFIDSSVGNGTKITLCFPRAVGEVTAGTETLVAEKPLQPKTNNTILIVEDEQDLLEYNEKLLSNIGYKVYTARNGAEGILKLDELQKLDLLLTDIVMPGGVTGKELAEEAKLSFPGIKILFTSGYSSDALEEKNAEFLPKPYMREMLIGKIQKLLQ